MCVDKCAASKALDGNKGTSSVTSYSNGQLSWWSAEFLEPTKIDEIRVWTHGWAVNNGYYNKFRVETRMYPGDRWEVCKAEHRMQVCFFFTFYFYFLSNRYFIQKSYARAITISPRAN